MINTALVALTSVSLSADYLADFACKDLSSVFGSHEGHYYRCDKHLAWLSMTDVDECTPAE